MSGITTGDGGVYILPQATKRVAHVIDDVDTNIIDPPAWFSLNDPDKTGSIMVVLADEPLTSKAVMDVQKAARDNILVKKIYLTGTVDITANDITLYR